MAKPVLNGPGVRASVGERVSAAMPQHVEVQVEHDTFQGLLEVTPNLGGRNGPVAGEWPAPGPFYPMALGVTKSKGRTSISNARNRE
jgi:hypothetical protein